MISEDYVSVVVAKLLKEKGFNEKTPGYYTLIKGVEKEMFFIGQADYYNTCEDKIAAPTIQMAVKWVAKKYQIYIYAEPHYEQVDDFRGIFSYGAVVCDISKKDGAIECLGYNYSWYLTMNEALRECLSIELWDMHMRYLLGEEGLAINKKTGEVYRLRKRKNLD